MNREQITQVWMKLNSGGQYVHIGTKEYRQIVFSEEELDYLRRLIPEEDLD